MRNKTLLVLLGVAAGALLASAAANQKRPELKTVEKVDLERYAGRWYEIAKYPNRFERDCDRDIIAEYSLRPDGKLTVVNSCTKADGTRKVARGKAKIADMASNAKLKVSFFGPFYGNYWIIDLDPQYRWAVVGEPKRKYLWILARDPQLDAQTYAEITSRLPAQGYNAAKLEMAKQTAK